MDLTRILKVESVSRLAPAEPASVGPQQTVRQAVERMQEKRCGSVLVCEGEKLLGIFTERDLIKRVLAPGRPLTIAVKECMTPNPVTVEIKDSVAVALRRMQEGGHRHLPVVDESGRAVGVIAAKQVIRFLVEYFPSAVYNQPPDPHAVQTEREGA